MYLTIPRSRVARGYVRRHDWQQVARGMYSRAVCSVAERIRNEGVRERLRVSAVDGLEYSTDGRTRLDCSHDPRTSHGQLTVIMRDFLRVNRTRSILNELLRDPLEDSQ